MDYCFTKVALSLATEVYVIGMRQRQALHSMSGLPHLTNYTTGPFEIGVPPPVFPELHVHYFRDLLRKALVRQNRPLQFDLASIRTPYPVTCLPKEKVASQISPASVALVRLLSHSDSQCVLFWFELWDMLKLVDSLGVEPSPNEGPLSALIVGKPFRTRKSHFYRRTICPFGATDSHRRS